MTEDRISLIGLKIQANHGVFDFEREQGQLFIVDVVAWVDLAGAADSDDLAKTVHYGNLAEEIVTAVATDPVDLIETVAERIAQVVLAHDVVERVKVTVHKPHAPMSVEFADVAVTIVRGRS